MLANLGIQLQGPECTHRYLLASCITLLLASKRALVSIGYDVPELLFQVPVSHASMILIILEGF